MVKSPRDCFGRPGGRFDCAPEAAAESHANVAGIKRKSCVSLECRVPAATSRTALRRATSAVELVLTDQLDRLTAKLHGTGTRLGTQPHLATGSVDTSDHVSALPRGHPGAKTIYPLQRFRMSYTSLQEGIVRLASRSHELPPRNGSPTMP